MIHPLRFLYDKESGKIYAGTQKTTKKVQNIRTNKIYLSVDDENYPYKGVKGKAMARISEDITEPYKVLPTLSLCMIAPN